MIGATPPPPTPPPAGTRCECGTELAASLLACPVCNRLVHARELERLAAEAQQAEGRSEWKAALATWRRALELLPEASGQARTIAERIAELREKAGEKESFFRVDPVEAPKPGTKWAKLLAPLGVAGLLLWKFKFVLVFVVSKLKFLLFGLSKSGSALTMLLSFGVYWAAFGWPLAAGLVISIYLHELGHVAAMARLGMKIEPPMFIPGIGAFIRLRQRPVDVIEDARIGLAGPIWGLGAALLALALGRLTGEPLWLAIAKLGAWINLFNLLPILSLDGSRAFTALARPGRAVATLAFGAAWYVTGDGLLILLALVAGFRVFGKAAEKSDTRTLVEFVGLVASLAALSMLPVKL